jgi:patatin-like phospholipase
MSNNTPKPIIERLINWLVSTKLVKWLDAFAEWIRKFIKVAHLARFSFWISVLGSASLFATNQSTDILRVIAEDTEHPIKSWLLFMLSGLVLSLMSWYWARALMYRFAPEALYVPRGAAEGVAARWLPRVCGMIPFIGIGFALRRAAQGLDADELSGVWLMHLFWLNLFEGLVVTVALFFRRKVAKMLKPLVSFWPEQVKRAGTNKLTDLPRLTWRVLLFTVTLSIILFVVFTTSKGQIEFASWLGTAPLLLLTVAAWIAFGSLFVIYFGKLVRLPILTPLLLLALLFSYFDWNDNHEIRSHNAPIQTAPQDFDAAFAAWWATRADKDDYKDRPYPVFIITAEGGGITTAYFTAMVLTAIQDRAPAFAQHVFAVSGVSGGSIGSAVYAGLARRCTNNLSSAQLSKQASVTTLAGQLQDSADAVLRDDYLSPLISAFLYPDLVQRFLPFPINRWDRARALDERLETSWAKNATCDRKTLPGTNEFAQPFYEFFGDFPKNSTPALFFNTTNVETGERMFVTNLGTRNARFDTLPALYDVDRYLNPPFSSAAFLSSRFPLVTPAGFLYDYDNRLKLRYVDGGYYENSGTATGYNILMSLKVDGAYLYEQLTTRRLQGQPGVPPIIPIIIRIGFPVPAQRSPSEELNKNDAAQREKYKGSGLNEIMSPVKTFLNTRHARGNDAVHQMQAAIANLQPKPATGQDFCPNGSLGCMYNFEINGNKVKLPLGWLLSKKSRCEIQKLVGSVSSSCASEPIESQMNDANWHQLLSVIGLLGKKT